MMDQEKKNISFLLVMLTAMMGIMVVGQWLLVTMLYMPSSQTVIELFRKLLQKDLFFRLLYVVLVVCCSVLFPLSKRPNEKYKWYYIYFSVLLGIAITLGFSRIYDWYNWIVYPAIFVTYTLMIPRTSAYFVTKHVKSDESIFGITNEKSDFYFEFETEEGPVSIHKPQQNIWIDGGPGSGKSETFIKGMIYQCAERGYGGFIYDWEGDPTKKGSPILSRVAYGSIQHFKQLGKEKVDFAFINFVDMSRTVRVNVLSEKYVPKGHESLFIRNIVVTLMKNLEPSWKEKTDFWANNAINFVYSIAYKCYKQRDLGINTLPHVIAFALSDSDLVFKWLSEDVEIALNMSSMLTAWKLGAQQQTAGAVSSAQTPLVLLNNKNIFWVMSPLPEEEYSLDITNPEHPTLLCVGNAPSIKESTSPPISCIASVLMFVMNNPGKIKGSVFMVDEFPTIMLQGIDSFIGTARKHYVATILALQAYNQAVRDYGEKNADVLRTNCGTQSFGMTGSIQTARDVETLFGEKREAQESFTHQDSGGGSISESLQKEKVLMGRDIAGQKAGHFTGKIANGIPPFFNCQFKLSKYVEEDIPPFSIPVKMGPGFEEKELEVLEQIVETNYTNIISTVNDILRMVKEKDKADKN